MHKSKLGYAIVTVIGLAVGVVLTCNGNAMSYNTAGEEQNHLSPTVNPGYAACIAPEMVPRHGDTFSETQCLDVGNLSGYEFLILNKDENIVEVEFFLEDDQTAILYVESGAIDGIAGSYDPEDNAPSQ